MSTAKFNKMKEYDDFKQIGKEIPFEVPVGFFESITEKTLKEAITREHIHKRNNLRWLIFSVAASVALFFFLGFHFLQDSAPVQVPNLIVEQTKPTVTKLGGDTSNSKSIVEMNKVIPEKLNERELTVQEKTEVLRDILSDLSDEDLDQISVRYKTDAFINESLQ